MESKNLQKLAAVIYDCLEEKERENGEKFLCIKDGLKKSTEDKVGNLILAAHNDGEFLPDDFRYNMIGSALSSIAAGSLDDENIYEIAGQEVDVYNSDLLRWVSSNLSRLEYVNEAVSEYGWPGDLMAAIVMGQSKEIQEIFGAVLHYLEKWND